MYGKTDECSCPLCDEGTLDTGGECDKCSYDRNKKLSKGEFTKAWLIVKDKPKHVIIEFLRNHG